MAELDEILTGLIDQVDGAVAAAIGGMDGLVVEQVGTRQEVIPAFVAELTNVLAASRSTLAARLDAGNLGEVVLGADRQVAYVRILSPDLFCVVLLDAGGNLGKARLYSGYAGRRVLEALA